MLFLFSAFMVLVYLISNHIKEELSLMGYKLPSKMERFTQDSSYSEPNV